jgi:hypothetical protein
MVCSYNLKEKQKEHERNKIEIYFILNKQDN